MELKTIDIPAPTLPEQLPTDHQALMNCFYDHWQALSADVRTQNVDTLTRAKAAGVDTSNAPWGIDLETYMLIREPRQAEIAKVFPPKINAAVIMGNMHYQIGNGGWLQWDDNGYSASLEALITLYSGAKDVGIADADKVLALLKEFRQRKSDDQGPRPTLFDGDEEYEDDSFDNFDDMCNRYYAIESETLMQAMLDRFDEVVASGFMAGAYKKAA